MCAARVTGSGPALTARESEVLELVRQRLTNQEIAELLTVSVRTVETHVSALLRKLGVDDRRALGRAVTPTGSRPAGARLPASLTPFVGRAAELEELCSAVLANRLVVATGPGGVGKTRLALAAAAAVAGSFDDGCVFVNLVPVVDPALVGDAVADACGVPERAGATREQTLVAALADRHVLLLVDNCEHVQDAARTTIERLLTACPGVRVLATSRLRLMLPFERVVPVGGLSLGEGGGGSDAVTLFVDRMTAAGARPPADDAEVELVRRICATLDGLALSIELAAARAPSLGLGGLLSALDSNLAILAVGSRAEHRHASLRAAIEWSYDLLGADAQEVLRAVGVFAGPFDLEAACAVVGLSRPAVVGALASLVDWNLVSLRPGRPDRYGVLELIRQYTADLDAFRAEEHGLRERHAHWCASRLSDLLALAPGDDDWCAEVDALLDEARAALAHLAASSPDGADADRRASFAGLLADVAFQRGRPGDAQRWYEEAAAATQAVPRRRHWLHLAAGAASSRNVGGQTIDLLLEASRLAHSTGQDDDAAADLANAAGLQFRAQGIVRRVVDAGQVENLLDRARQLNPQGAVALAAIAVAEGWTPDATARSRAATERAVELAERCGDPVLLDEALDQLSVLQVDEGDLAAGAATIERRLELLSTVPLGAASGFSHYDSLQMACQVNLAMGRLEVARRHADAITALPFFRQERHIGLARRLGVDALSGDFRSAVEHAGLFERDWRRTGRPVAGNLAVGAYATAMVFGMLDDAEGRDRWGGITTALLPAASRLTTVYNIWRALFDGLLALHRDDLVTAAESLAREPGAASTVRTTTAVLWEPWYAAAWAETGVLSGDAHASNRLDRARLLCSTNAIALAVVDRSAALHAGRGAELAAIAARLDDLGCRYQADRTRLLAKRAGAPVGPSRGAGGPATAAT